MRLRLTAVCLIAAVLLWSSSLQADVINGGFETGAFAPWSYAADGNVSIVNAAILPSSASGGAGLTFSPFAGSFMAQLGIPGSADNFNVDNQLKQKFTNSSGYAYLSFAYNAWTYDHAPNDSPSFSVLLNGTQAFLLAAQDLNPSGAADGKLRSTGWKEVSLSLPSSALDPETRISLLLYAGDTNSSSLHSGVFIDEVRLTATAVPTPGSIWLLGSGLVALFGLARQTSPRPA